MVVTVVGRCQVGGAASCAQYGGPKSDVWCVVAVAVAVGWWEVSRRRGSVVVVVVAVRVMYGGSGSGSVVGRTEGGDSHHVCPCE